MLLRVTNNRVALETIWPIGVAEKYCYFIASEKRNHCNKNITNECDLLSTFLFLTMLREYCGRSGDEETHQLDQGQGSIQSQLGAPGPQSLGGQGHHDIS